MSVETTDLKPETQLRLVWGRFLDTSRARLRALQHLTLNLAAGGANQDQLSEATGVARQIVDACDAFRLPEAVHLATAVEHSLTRLTQSEDQQRAQAGPLAQLLLRLGYELERGPLGRLEVPRSGQPQLWIFSRDAEQLDRLTVAATSRGYQVYTYEDGADLGEDVPPSLILFDLSAGGGDRLRVLRDRFPAVPLAVISEKDSFALRLEAARSSVSAFLLRSDGPRRLFEVVGRALAIRDLSKGRVLVVDDDPIIRDIVQVLLEQEGFTVHTLENASELMEALELANPDLVILDYQMPQATGNEVCRILRGHSNWSSVPIVFLTKESGDKIIQQVFASGADDFIAKPLKATELIARVTNRLQQARAQRLHADVDNSTGMPGRHRSLQDFTLILRLAERQRVPVSFALLRVEPLQHGQDLNSLMPDVVRIFRSELRRPGDIVARWEPGLLALAMYDTTRVFAQERLSKLLADCAQVASVRVSLASFPADGVEILRLIRAMETVLVDCPASVIRTVAAERNRAYDMAWVMDDFDDVFNVHKFFRSRGRRVRWLFDSLSVMDALFGATAEQTPGVLCLDLQTSFLDGFDLLKRLRGTSMRVIVLSDTDHSADILRAQEAGAYDFLSKPFDLPMLAQRVDRALGDAG